MNIGIIGAGNVGTGLGKRLAAKGHAVTISFARTPEKVQTAAQTIGGSAQPGSPEEAARFGKVVILATPWATTLAAVRQIAPALAGKIVWDTTNPLKADMSGLEVGTTTSAGEEVAKAALEARVVKAVPPFAEVLHSPSTLLAGTKPGVFVCGDDAAARKTICELVDQVDAVPTDAGPLALARYTEPLGMLLVQLAYVQGFGARIGASLLRGEAPAGK